MAGEPGGGPYVRALSLQRIRRPKWLVSAFSVSPCAHMEGASQYLGVEVPWARSSGTLIIEACAGSSVTEGELRSTLHSVIGSLQFRTEKPPSFYVRPII
ncbi:MAG: hypothetical protein ACYDGN_08255 [Acidimicrobiales bacterium]